MDISVYFGDLNISIDRVIEQLHRFKLLPQLIREIIADDLIAEIAVVEGIELGAAAEDRQQRDLGAAIMARFNARSQTSIGKISSRRIVITISI